jgi:RNA polymerase sigma factor (sigma-70 family)
MITTHHITQVRASERARDTHSESGTAIHRSRPKSIDHGARSHAPRRLPSTSRTSTRARLNGEDVARLVRSAAAGDSPAWDGLVEEFAGMVWAVARGHRLGDADVADVSQATWLKLLERLDDIHEPSRVGAWLATTARRECLRVLRAAQRHVLCGEDAEEHETPDLTPDDALLLAERDQALWRGFGRLRERDQRLLSLLMAEPRPAYEEISAALGIPVGAIGPTRGRALARLRQELESAGTLALVSA